MAKICNRGRILNSAKGKGAWGQVRGNRPLPESFSQRNGTGHTPFPQQEVVTICGKCHQGSSLETPYSGLSWGVGHKAPSVWHVRKFPAPWRKAEVQHKPYLFVHTAYAQWATLTREWQEPPQSKFLNVSQLCKQVFCRRAISGPLCWLFSVQGPLYSRRQNHLSKIK